MNNRACALGGKGYGKDNHEFSFREDAKEAVRYIVVEVRDVWAGFTNWHIVLKLQ